MKSVALALESFGRWLPWRTRTRSPASRIGFAETAGLVVVLLMAVFTGAATGAGLYILVAPLALLLPAAYLLARPEVCLVFFAGLTLVVAGTLKFFLGMGQFQWALSALGLALLAYSVVRTVSIKSPSRAPVDAISQAWAVWWAGLLFASMANALPAPDWLVGLRIYLPVFGIYAYLAWCRPDEKLLKRMLLFMVALACIQCFFCLYQKMVVVPARIAGHYPGSPWDSIVGTFGGEKFGGGESGSLGVYLSVMIVLAVALKKQAQIGILPFATVFLTGFAAMALTESKVVALMIPLGCFLVYRDYVFTRPARFLAGTALTGVLMLSVLTAYYYLYWSTGSRLDLLDALAARFAYSFDPHFQASRLNLGRIGSLIFWWDKHALIDNPVTLLLGHGLASAVSGSSIIGQGVAVQRYGIMLDVTGVSKLLWETGLLGTLFFLAVFAFAFQLARRLKNHPLLPAWHRAAMAGVEAAMVLMPLSIFYEVTVVSSPPMQFVAMFLLGYVVFWQQRTITGVGAK